MSICTCKKRDYEHPKIKTDYFFHWSFGNSKLAKDGTVSFNLPAFRSRETGFVVCKSASVCALVCYARQGRYTTPKVNTPREHNLEYLRNHSTQEFITLAVQDIAHLHPSWRHIRLHDSGDFYSPAYFLGWIEIARQCKDMLFYGYSKEILLIKEFRHIFPNNFHMIQSYGGTQDALIEREYAHSVIFPTHKERKLAGYVNASHTDKPAFQRKIKLGLVYHGTSRLTEIKTQLLVDRIPLALVA